ncbi:MAG: GGDEF domain-containing protein [Kofleriaceae bacterium]|jgi:two-component system cell cycle response regulator|nr:GGDEF domain-containing protein [Kofleriaceae bacterium]MBP9170176.1 GGDEF domain-containing protein [Kofleriaceae bacterium]MBP9859829.1 GGDEF domain-containing protein [Kofleriaceae bacterium]
MRPTSTGESCLVLLHPPGPDIGRRTALTKQLYLIGRDTDADLVISRSAVSRHHAQLAKEGDGAWWAIDLGSTNGTFVNEQRIQRHALADGDQVRFGDAIFKFLSGANIESAYHEEIYRMTILDGLTGIHNKRYFLEFIDRELAGAKRHGHALSLVMFDIDFFKRINDEHGHLAGDQVLKDLTGRLKARMRREDLFARYGGEEFACVLSSTGLDGGVIFAEHVRALMAERPVIWNQTAIPVTVSLGVACAYNEPNLDPPTLIKRADDNLYVAKRNGRNQVVPAPQQFGFPAR